MALLAWLIGWPLAVTVAAAIATESGGAGAAFAEFARRPEEWLALGRSLWISAASVAAAAAVGVPLAFLFARAEFPGRRLLGELVALPVALPPLVGVIAFLYLYGESGVATRVIGGARRQRRPALAADRRGSDPHRPRLLDVRLLLPVHARGARPFRRLAARGGGVARRGAGPALLHGHPAGAAPGARRGRAAHLPHRARLVLGALPVRRHLPGDDHPDPRVQTERRRRSRRGRDRGARAGRDRRARRRAPARALDRGRAAARRAAGAAREPAAGGARRARRRRLGARAAAPAAAPDPRRDVARAARDLDDRAAAARALVRQLARLRGLGRGAAPARQLALDGARRDRRRARPRLRHGPSGGARGRAGTRRRAADGPALGGAGDRLRGRARHHLERPAAARRPVPAGRYGRPAAAGVPDPGAALDRPRHARRARPARSGSGGGGGLARRLKTSDARARNSSGAAAGAGGGGRARLPRRLRRLRALDRPLHLHDAARFRSRSCPTSGSRRPAWPRSTACC